MNFHVSVSEETLQLTSGTQKQVDWHHEDVRCDACIACHRLHTQEACILSLPTLTAAEPGASLPIRCAIPVQSCAEHDARTLTGGRRT